RTWDVCIDNPTSLPSWVRDAGKVLRGNVGHYLFISTISVYADGSRPGISEDDAVAAYRGRDAMAETRQSLMADMENLYGPLKALSEAEARTQFGERTTIVRPGYIVGPRDETDRFTYWPLRVAQGGQILVPGDGQDPLQVIDGGDVGEGRIRRAEQGATGTLHRVGPGRPGPRLPADHGCHAVRLPGGDRHPDDAHPRGPGIPGKERRAVADLGAARAGAVCRLWPGEQRTGGGGGPDLPSAGRHRFRPAAVV